MLGLCLSRIRIPLLTAGLVVISGMAVASPVSSATLVTMASNAASQGFPNAGTCTRIFRAWRNFEFEEDPRMDVCQDFMGINQYCAAHDSFVAVGYDRDQTYRYLVCAPYSHPDSIGEQFLHLAKGIGEGFVAAVPFVSGAVTGLACASGQIYACAVLALELSDAAGVPIAGVGGEALAIATEVGKCTDGDVVECAKIGLHGAKAAGLAIPGKDAAQVASDAQQCDQGDFAACMRLGQTAADAGGVPRGFGNGSFVNAQDCLDGDQQACTRLGKEAAAAQAPMGGVMQGAQDLQGCSGGNAANCTHLGKSLAKLTRAPQTGLTLGREHSTTPSAPPKQMGNEPLVCARARNARARQSPLAPDLTAQCEALGGDFTERKAAPLPANSGPDLQPMKSRMIVAPEPPICIRARDARARNSPAASALETQCRQAGGTP
jgi:hypothetical protein